MRDRSDAMRMLFGEEDFAKMAANPTRFRQTVVDRSQRWNKIKSIVEEHVQLPPTKNISVSDIQGSLNKMTDTQRRNVLQQINAANPQAMLMLKAASKQQNKQKIGDILETTNPAPALGRWLDKNTAVLRELHGQGYVRDLQALQRGLKASTIKERGVAPDSQPGWLRLGRTYFGPLSKPQRIITAVTWNQKRIVARNMLNVIADPEKLAAFRVIRDTNQFTRAAMATLTRIGIFDGTEAPEDAGERFRWFNSLTAEIVDLQNPDTDPDASTPALPAAPAPPPVPKSERPTVMPGRGTISSQRDAAIRASTSDLDDLNKLGN